LQTGHNCLQHHLHYKPDRPPESGQKKKQRNSKLTNKLQTKKIKKIKKKIKRYNNSENCGVSDNGTPGPFMVPDSKMHEGLSTQA
jgi:hypothetical protein